jgi:hypothetical protein
MLTKNVRLMKDIGGLILTPMLIMLLGVAANAQKSPAFPLKVSASGRYLADQHNVPFLIAGDSPQGLMGRLTEAQAEEYFADRQALGFNTVGWVDVVCAGSDYPENTMATTPDGIRPFTGFVTGGSDYAYYDITKPNEAYFKRLDHIVTIAAKHEIVVFLDPMETIGWLSTLRNNGPAAAYAYGQYLGTRYKKYYNVAWLLGNDFYNWRVGSDDSLVLAVAKGIKDNAPRQIQSIELNPPTSSSFDDSAWIPFISINGTYTYSPTYIEMEHSYNQTPTAPTYLMEAHYDLEAVGSPPDFGSPSVLRRQEYWTMLSGGAGQFYGNSYTWSFKSGWQNNLDTPGARQLSLWKKLFTSLPWQDLIPDQDNKIVAVGGGSYGDLNVSVSKSNYCTAARTKDGSLVAVYVPDSPSITINMSALRAPALAKWFDPTDGTYTDAAASRLANSGGRQFVRPGTNHDGDSDWVLLLTVK